MPDINDVPTANIINIARTVTKSKNKSPKRKRGRPKKSMMINQTTEVNTDQDLTYNNIPTMKISIDQGIIKDMKRKRGRPKKNDSNQPSTPKRPRGRPKKIVSNAVLPEI